MAAVQLPEPFASIPRVTLLFEPSPIQELPNITKALGGEVNIYAKREDCNSGLAFGGNKTRKLEYFVPDAISSGCDTLISIGGVQSNHTRQVAAVAAKTGLKAALVQERWVDWEDTVYDKVGNIQLSRLMGAETLLDPSSFGIEHKETLANLKKKVIDAGGKPYYIPAGASDHPLGGLGFARWAFEVEMQEKELGVFFDTIIVCVVTGSTMAGMVAGFKLAQKNGSRPRKLIGIDASAKVKQTFDQVLRITKATAVKIGLKEDDITGGDIILDDRYHAGCYGIPDTQTIDAIKFGASKEGFITDPVYEGKSLAGLIDMVKKGEIRAGSNVLYAHLGGQMKWRCVYPDTIHSSSGKVEKAQLTKSSDLNRRIERQKSEFPAVFFLDAELFNQWRLQLPRDNFEIAPEVRDFIGDASDIRATATDYFNTIHSYIPIISKTMFYQHLLNPLATPGADVILLFLCMKLIMSVPSRGHEAARMPIYKAARALYTAMESSGVSSIHILQAGVLIAFYEISHAVYPLAFFTISACARYGSLFGLDERGLLQTTDTRDWIRIEEKRRVWWALVILDRFANLGQPTRLLAIEDPKSSSVLPMDDDTWDKGDLPSEYTFTLSSPSSVLMGKFARLAQTGYLLGQILHHISDYNSPKELHDEIGIQLYRTMHSLVTLSHIEASIRALVFCPQTAICYCGLLLLQNRPNSPINERILDAEHFSSISVIAETTMKICKFFLDSTRSTLPKISPFLLPSLYRAGIIYLEEYNNSQSEKAWLSLCVLKDTMGVINGRWKAAGAFLKILEAREATYH
ncbi:hypothetical protein B7463_g11147, partial [Scytalidium lignicola]